MGASLSNTAENGTVTGKTGLGDIPESCVACVFMYLTPPEICNLARLNRAFSGAASSDAVWESKLPSNYHHMLDLLPPWRYEGLSKKSIFALLSRPFSFDEDNKVNEFVKILSSYLFDPYIGSISISFTGSAWIRTICPLLFREFIYDILCFDGKW